MMAVSLLTATTAFATKPVPEHKIVSKSIAEYVEDNLDFPSFAVDNNFQGEVVLSLVIREDGSFDVIRANCVNADVKQYVVESIEKMQKDIYSLHAGDQVNLKIKFVLIK